MNRCRLLWICVALHVALLAAGPAWSICTPGPNNPLIRFETVLGDYEVVLCAEDAPDTVANFMAYVDSGLFQPTGFVHRHGLVGIDIIQGGGYWVDLGIPQVFSVATFPAIELEATGLSNLRGTIAMARESLPDTATSQWFINITDNVVLDTSGGGYAVFGYVFSGMSVVDAIAAQDVWNAGAPFNELPLIDYPGGLVFDYFVYVTDVVSLPEPSIYLQLGVGVVFLSAAASRRHRRR